MPNLVGIGLSQVPTNSMLGGLAYQSPDHASIKDLDLKNLSQINSEIADTAVDIFIYDTSKDSDGGAWRKRTTHTSWYNETLGTATRGTRREFPAVAVIVAEAQKLTIYDGDDPDLPMWMVYESGGTWNTTNNVIFSGNGDLTSVTALNGEIVFGTGQYGVVIQNFIEDRGTLQHISTFRYLYPSSISRRNSGDGSGPEKIPYTSYTLIDTTVNDVAMTVLPNAPIDIATGLPVPTIAVATNGGVSVIKDDGSVYDINHTSSGYDVVSQIKIDEKYVYIGFGRASDYVGGIGYAVPIPGADVSLGSIVNATSESVFRWSLNSTSGSGGQSDYFINPSDSNADDVTGTVLTKRGMSFGTETGMSILLNEERGTNGSVAYATTSYNTGWMHGDIKGAFLSDTDATNITGSEVVTNGDFATSTLTSYGQLYNCSLSVVSNQLRVTSTASSGYCEFYITMSDTTKYHYFSFQFVGASGITQFGIYGTTSGYITDTNAGWTNSAYTTSRSAGTYTLLIPPGNLRVGFVFALNSLGQTWTFDNISLKPVQELDRSVNNRGLQVFGTVTKSAVATGAELVAYSNFSSSNYFIQPYNSDFNFGSGDFFVSAWIKMDSLTTYSYIFDKSDSNGSNRFALYTTPSNVAGGAFEFYTSSGASYSSAIPTGKWIHVAWRRSGSTNGKFVDGELQGSFTNSEPLTGDTTAKLYVGRRYTNSNHMDEGSIALLRFSASAPSDEQIKKIYEDEKFLFQENAACTLYGSSDAVTALAYDEVTERLHVGTSSGRSDFQGLRRINNTTTAVTTAISAHDEFIVEQ